MMLQAGYVSILHIWNNIHIFTTLLTLCIVFQLFVFAKYESSLNLSRLPLPK